MKVRKTIETLIILAALTGCKDYDDVTYVNVEPVDAELAFTVSQGTERQTRMDAGITQTANGSFRGLNSLRAFPFAISSSSTRITTSDQPKLTETNGYTEEYDEGKTDHNTNETIEAKANFYYIENCSFMPGVNAFLAYALATTKARAANVPTTSSTSYSATDAIDNKLYNGSLTATIPLRGTPSGISFAPEQIVQSDDIVNGETADGTKMANYLTSIATATGWSTATESNLRAYYLNFIGQDNDGNHTLVASSSTNVQKHVASLRTQISAITGLSPEEETIQTAIITAIDAGYDNSTGKLKSTIPANYPASLGLPAGAASVRWNKASSKFEVQTVTTTEAPINGVTRYAYPAELWYYTNSLIKTSAKENLQEKYASTGNWYTLLNEYENDNGAVSNHTKSIAIKEPLQYAVGRLEVLLNPVTTTTIPDADGTSITVGTTNFPLTGIIVGKQRPVGFDFQPTVTQEQDGTYSDLAVRLAYDPYPVGPDNSALYLTSNTSAATSILVLQTPDGEEVPIILEFQNNSTTPFRGRDGVVYPDTKFYLTGKLQPNVGSGTDTNAQGRVFTQDYTTQVKVSVQSLAKAYNVLPDILTARLEIGVVLTTDWEQTTPVNVPLN